MHWTKGQNAKEIIARINAKKALNPTRYWLGKTHSQETRDKISEAKGGKVNGRYRSIKIFGKRADEHRIVMAEVVGRELRPHEIVHHWDENKINNAPENLSLLRHRAAHVRLHAFANRHGIKVSEFKFEQAWLSTV